MRGAIALLALLAAAGTARADVYMHNPRGSNDRNCERYGASRRAGSGGGGREGGEGGGGGGWGKVGRARWGGECWEGVWGLGVQQCEPEQRQPAVRQPEQRGGACGGGRVMRGRRGVRCEVEVCVFSACAGRVRVSAGRGRAGGGDGAHGAWWWGRWRGGWGGLRVCVFRVALLRYIPSTHTTPTLLRLTSSTTTRGASW
jgi:hypothetical protein